MASRKKTAALARQLFKLSLDHGRLAPELVEGVLAWVDKHRPPDTLSLLRNYKHLVEAEVDRHRAVIEYAGEMPATVFASIAAAMSRRFGREIEPVPVQQPDLIAGVRVRVGCDIFENSVAGNLAVLHSAS